MVEFGRSVLPKDTKLNMDNYITKTVSPVSAPSIDTNNLLKLSKDSIFVTG